MVAANTNRDSESGYQMKKFLAPFSLLVLTSTLGLAQEIAEQKVNKRYLSADITLYQTMGSGVISKKLAPSQSLLTDLNLIPTLKSKTFWGDRFIQSELDFYASFEWFAQNTGNPEDRLSFNDTKLRFLMKNALGDKDVGLTFNAGIETEIPSTPGSSIANRIFGIGPNLALKWSKWGFSLSYKPVAVAYMHSLPYKSSTCNEANAEGDNLGDGQCKVTGQQTMLMWKNGLYAEYETGAHTIMVGLKTYHGFLRQSPESIQKYNESTLGMLEYTYNFPTELDMGVTLGLSSLNPAYNPSDGTKVPFFSRHSSSSNFTNVYLAYNIVL